MSTYYVRNSGSNANDGLTEATPFRTMDKAFAAAGRGDSITLLPDAAVNAGLISGDANNQLDLGADNKLFSGGPFADARIYAVNQINQSGTAAPTFVLVKNTLGFTPVWTRTNTGQYSITYAAGFPALKTMVFFQGALNTQPRFADCLTYDNDNIFINTRNAAGALADGILFVCSLVVIVLP